jgi:HlyD family secretion protein
MKNYLNKIKLYIVAHKKISIIALIIILLFGYWGYKKITNTSGETRYVTSVVAKGTIISSVDGTGQVSASSQVDLKAKASGDIVSVGVKGGQKVSTGTIIAQIDSKDAQKSLRDAELNLQNAKLSLEKLKIQNSDANISADLQKAYDDGFTAASDAFLDLPTTITGLENVLAQENISDNAARSSGQTASDYRDQAEKLYYEAESAFGKNRIKFRLLDRNSSKSDIEAIINQTYETTKILSDAIKSTKNLVDYFAEDTGNTSNFTSSQSSLSTYTNTISAHLSSLFSAQQDIKDNKQTVSTSGLDIESSELSVQQKENALQDLKDALSDYYVRAPFDGTIASVSVEKSDSVSSGTVVASLITKKQIAEIPFNEVDVAKIKVGQKTTLTFDAIQDLTISGEVAEIDSVGTVSSGVVNYNVKIGFDTQDDRIKPSMSVSAAIITDMAQDVFVVSSSAVKSKNGSSYVEIFDTALSEPVAGVQGSISKVLPRQQIVTVGISDDTSTEIVSGLKEGDIIVTKTITGTTTTTTNTKSILGSMGGGGPKN